MNEWMEANVTRRKSGAELQVTDVHYRRVRAGEIAMAWEDMEMPPHWIRLSRNRCWDGLSANHLLGNCRRSLGEQKSVTEKESGSERVPGNSGETLFHKYPIASGGLLASIPLWLLAEWLVKLGKVVGTEMQVLEVGSSRRISSALSQRAMVVMEGPGKPCCCSCERAAGFELELATTSPSQSPCGQWPIVLDSFTSWAQGWKGTVTM